jgi:DNA repair photolyase
MVRGALTNPHNRFSRQILTTEHTEGIDEWISPLAKTQYIEQEARSLVNKVDSPDVGMSYSMNPYGGCEHGCVYCYARNSHEYLGYSAGLDFESKIIVKTNAPQLLRKFLNHPKWEGQPLSLSGNTDCYQPAEKKYRLTRKLLEICDIHNQPVSLITKNGGILHDKDILQKMAKRKLTSVMVSITSMDEELRQKMEPRTTTAEWRFRVIRELSEAGVPTGVMVGPVIPGLNDHQIQKILWNAAASGASFASYTFVRLNGSVKDIFQHWLQTHFPDKAEKVWHLIEEGHGGQVSDSRFGLRMKGEGAVADIINQQFKKYCRSYRLNTEVTSLNSRRFCVPGKQLSFF